MTAHADIRTRADAGRVFTISSEFKAFIARLHFYAGLFVGPFILVRRSGYRFAFNATADRFGASKARPLSVTNCAPKRNTAPC